MDFNRKIILDHTDEPSVITKALNVDEGGRRRKQEGYKVRRTRPDNFGFEDGGKGSGA